MVPILGAATGWLLLAALVVSVGTVTARWVLVPRAVRHTPAAGATLSVTAARLGLRAAVALAVAMLLVFARQLQEFRDPFATWAEEGHLLLTGTAWGSTWILAAVASVVAALGFAAARAGVTAGWWSASATVLGLAAYPAFTGHAAGTDALRPLTLAADTLHVMAAGVWVGGLTFVLYAERAWRARSDDPFASVLPALVPAFSPMAVGAVVTLIVTGTFASWVHVDGLNELVGTGYGRLLTAKLAIVVLVSYLGAVNWRRLTPQLGTEVGQAALRRNAATELLLAQIVLVVTAILVRTSPLDH